LNLFLSKLKARFDPYAKQGHLESSLLGHLVNVSNLEAKAMDCTKVMMWEGSSICMWEGNGDPPQYEGKGPLNMLWEGKGNMLCEGKGPLNILWEGKGYPL
jgi:hypothetical protein